VIWDLVKEYDYPVCFNFPVGHINDNRTMIIGEKIKLSIDQQNTSTIQS
jgi:muramoyltetrapeptide carboxypeptidase